jgi:hypothetical protein
MNKTVHSSEEISFGSQKGARGSQLMFIRPGPELVPFGQIISIRNEASDMMADAAVAFIGSEQISWILFRQANFPAH